MNKIEEYDKQLKENIVKLEQHINKAEEIAKDFMRSYETSEKVIREVMQKAHKEGKQLSITGDASSINDLVELLLSMIATYKNYPFRIEMSYFGGTKVKIIFKDSWSIINTCPLNDEEYLEYTKYWQATFQLNYVSKEANIYIFYPTHEFMDFTSKMLFKYGTEKILCEHEKYDERMSKT